MSPKKWRMANGKFILIKKMSDGHLVATLNMLYRQALDRGYPGEDGFPTNDWYTEDSEYITPLETELKRRGLTTEEHLNFNIKLKKEKERVKRLIEGKSVVATKFQHSFFKRLFSKYSDR